MNMIKSSVYGHSHFKKLLYFLFIVGATCPLLGQNFMVEDVTLRPLNGRVSQVVFKDATGFIWFGTNGGLFRYDGFDVKSYFNTTNDSTSISANHVFSICQDEEGIIWMGTLAGGLCRFDPKTESFKAFLADSKDPNALSNNNIFGVDVDQDGNVWMVTNGGGISILPTSEKHKSKPKFEQIPSLADNRMFTLKIDRNNQFWSGITDGPIIRGTINRANLSASSIEEISCLGPEQEEELGNFYHAIEEDQDGNIWVATTRYGVKKVDAKTGQIKHLGVINPRDLRSPENYIKSLHIHPEGFVLLGTEQGLWTLKKDIDDNYKIQVIEGTEKFTVTKTYYDREDNLWVSLSEGGVKKLITNNNVQFVQSNGEQNALRGKWVKSLAETQDGQLLLGTWISGGLFQLTVSDQPAVESPTVSKVINEGFDVAQLYVDRSNNLWISTFDNGLMVLEEGTQNLRKLPVAKPGVDGLSSSFVQGVVEDPQTGNFWIGTENGLDYFEPANNRWQHFKHDPNDPTTIADNRVQSNAMVFDRQGRLWLGTWSGGISCYNPETGVFRSWKNKKDDPYSIAKNEVISLLVDRKDQLWIGTFEGGLSKVIEVDSNAYPTKFKNFKIADGLPGNKIFALVEDQQGRIWGSTNFGIFSMDANDNISSYGKEDGIPLVDFYFSGGETLQDGRIAFGGTLGMILFHPDSLSNRQLQSKVVLTSFSAPNGLALLDSSITYHEEINLYHPSQSFTIGFSALTFDDYNYRNFSYRLLGVDEDWNKLIGRNYVSYHNLPYGNFTFEVYKEGQPASLRRLKVKVVPPWWKRKEISYLALALGVVFPYLLIFLRNRSVRRQNALLEDKVEKRTAQVKELNQLLKNQNDALEEQVKVRTSELEENNQMLVRKNAEMERFTYIASHDLKEPLRNISSFAGLLERKLQSATKEVKDYLQIIKGNAQRMNTLIEDLLEYTRVKKVNAPAEEVNLEGILQEIQSLKEEGAKLGTGEIQFDSLPTIWGHRTQLFILFKNLIDNGLKYNESASPLVKLTYESSMEHHIFIFTDNGIGIEESFQEKIFEMFTRLHNQTKYQGSGLGLAICRNIVHRMDGQIELESQVGQGSTFRVKIPKLDT